MIAYPSQYYHARFDFEFMSVNFKTSPNFELCKRARGKVITNNVMSPIKNDFFLYLQVLGVHALARTFMIHPATKPLS